MKICKALLTLATLATIGTANANNIDQKTCKYLNGHLFVQLADTTVKLGKEATPVFNYILSAPADGEHGEYVNFKADYCIDQFCGHQNWNSWVDASTGLYINTTGRIVLHRKMLNKGTYNATFRIYSTSMQCDVTAVSTIFVV